jgi:hypothetical protein
MEKETLRDAFNTCASAIDWPYLKLISTPASPPNFSVEFGCKEVKSTYYVEHVRPLCFEFRLC